MDPLIRAASELITFCTSNIGPTADWPIRLHCDDPDTQAKFRKHWQDLCRETHNAKGRPGEWHPGPVPARCLDLHD